MYVLSWLALTCPIYWKKVVDLLHPYASLLCVHILNMLDILCTAVQPVVELCHVYMTRLSMAVC